MSGDFLPHPIAPKMGGCGAPPRPPVGTNYSDAHVNNDTSYPPPRHLSFPTPGKTVPHHPLEDGHQVTVPHPPPPPGGPHHHRTRGAEREHVAVRGTEQTVPQDGLAITVISDAAICITVLRMSNDLRQKRCPRGADEHHICPKGKHGCAVKFHFSESEQNVLP